MTNILDQVAHDRSVFRPETPQEFFALQLARKLDDVKSVRSYVALAERFSEENLLRVYRHALDRGRGEAMAERFRQELRRWTGKEDHEQTDQIGGF